MAVIHAGVGTGVGEQAGNVTEVFVMSAPDAPVPPSQPKTSWLAILGLILLPCVAFGLIWWVVVGSQSHVLTYEEQMQQSRAEIAKTQNDAMQSEEVLRLAKELDYLRALPHPTKVQRARMSACITRIGVLNPSLVHEVH